MIEQIDLPGGAGTLHLRRLPAVADDSPPLLCLHPAPFDGTYFEKLMPLLNARRAVLAPDYPGHGGSSRPASPPDIGTFATAAIEIIDALSLDARDHVDLMGFHTGCLVAIDAALRVPARVRHLVLIDVPYFTGAEQRNKYREAIPTEPPPPDMWGFHAAFTYDCAKKFAALNALDHPDVALIATRSALRDPTRNAAEVLSRARLTERDDITRPVFDAHAPGIAAEILANLDA